MNDTNNTAALLEGALALAADAGRRIMEVYHRGFGVEHKEDNSPLTEADLAAHNAIVAGLGVLTPEWPVLSEESGTIPYAMRAIWQRYWLVDPLDGTREFVKRNGEFTVNIALIEGGEPVLGVVHVPVSGVSYYARRGAGAYRREGSQQAQSIRARAWDGGKLAVAGSRSHGNSAFERFLAAVGDYEILTLGSSLKFCLVAEGKADIYVRLGPTSEWDTAAAQCVVEEAGGRVTDTQLRPLRYNTKESLLNPSFFAFGDVRHDWRRYLPTE